MVWLTHILSEGDHRLNHVEAWAEKRQHTLEISTGQQVRGLEWSDDRLGIVLDKLADAEKWKAFETNLNRRTIRVYDLRPRRVRGGQHHSQRILDGDGRGNVSVWAQ